MVLVLNNSPFLAWHWQVVKVESNDDDSGGFGASTAVMTVALVLSNGT